MPRTSHVYHSGKRKLSGLCVLLLAFVTGFTAAKAQSPPTGLVSVNMSGTSSSSYGAWMDSTSVPANTVSADGRYVVFLSDSGELVPNDTNGVTDIFRRDLLTGQTMLVSVNASGTASANSSSAHPVITPDGRYVVFTSSASNLVTDNPATSFSGQLYVRDMQLGVTKLVDRNLAGTAHGNGSSAWPETLEISADGRYIAFVSSYSDLVLNDNNHQTDVFVRDLQTNSTILVSRNLAATASGNDVSGNPAMTPDGRYVAFRSSSSDLVANDTNGPREDIFLRDLQTGVTKLVSVNRFGTGSGNGPSDYRKQSDLEISPDGRYIAFVSSATDLVENDNNGLSVNDGGQDVFVRDMQLEKTTLVSIDSTGVASANGNSGGLAMTPDGRFVAFISDANNLLVANTDSNNLQDVFVRDLVAGTTTLISVNRNGVAGGSLGTANSPIFHPNSRPRISNDGRYISFVNRAGDLTPIDNYNPNFPAETNVYVRDRQLGKTTLVSVDTTGTKNGKYGSSTPVMTPDGRFIFYFSVAPDLVAHDTNDVGDVFYYINIPQPGQLQFHTTVNSINEGGGSLAITVTLLSGLSSPVSVNYSTANGTATAGSDYLGASGVLTFAPGESAKTFNVSVLDDSLDEDDERIYLKLSDPTGGASLGEPRVAALVIADDDPTPALSINDVSVTEGNSATTNISFTVALSAPSGRVVRVNFATEAGTAASGNDYVRRNNTLTFNPGETTKTITVVVNGDMVQESNETFFVNLTGPTNAVLGKAQGIGTILNDDAFQPVVQFQQNYYDAGESNGSISILISREADLSVPITVNYSTSDSAAYLQNCNVKNNAATSRCDYVGVLGTLHFAAGETSKTISIPIVDDTYAEGVELFYISLSNPTGGAVLGTNQTATIYIFDNSNDGAGAQPNPIDNPTFFVRQHYIDFLSREPDPASAGWVTQLSGCGTADQSCRLAVSQGIYSSPEFKDRGYFIYKFFSVGLGRKPSYDEFNVDRARVSGFQTDAELEQSKKDFIADFMSRSEFANIYNGLSNDAYVQQLFTTAGVTQITVGGVARTLSAEQQLLAAGTINRAQVLRDVAESAEASARFQTESTVVMHYFGYLRRDPDAAYQDWITILTVTGDSRKVTEGFVNSAEYRARFGQ